jgi:protein-tyrosine phosphatase
MDATLVQSFGKGELWVGGRVLAPPHLTPYDMFVASAVELPYTEWEQYVENILVVRCPLHDDLVQRPHELDAASKCSKLVGRALIAGKKVLVTCAMGLNRSALIAALALKQLTFCTPEQAILALRKARSDRALNNPRFIAYLRAGVMR